MTIAAYTGLPGHGKSYGVVENVIVPALKAKREVFTNIPMNEQECLKRFGMQVIQFQTQDIIENPDWWTEVFNPGAVIIIDEVWRLWPSGLNAKNVRDQDKAFLAEHRHMVGDNGQSTEIVFVTQDLAQIANFARCLVESTFRVVKLSKIGMNKRFRVDIYFGAVTGNNPPTSKRESEKQGKFKKSIYQLYQSHTKSLTGGAGDETRIDKRFNVLGGFSVKLGLFALCVCLVIFYFTANYIASYYGLSEKKSLPKKNQISNVNISKVEPVVSHKKPIFRFLSKAESFHMTGHFITYFGDKKIEERIFEVYFKESQTTLNDKDLVKLGYKIEIVNDCMAIVKGEDFNGYALCPRRSENSNWVEELIPASSNEST